MKKKVISSFAVLCTGVLLFDFCFVGTKHESIKENTLTAGASAMVSDVITTENDLSISESGAVVTAMGSGHYGYQQLGVSIADENLNIRKEPSSDSKIVGKMPVNGGCEVISNQGDWLEISSGEITGYVSSQYMAVGDEAVDLADEIVRDTATVTADVLNVRLDKNTDCEILSTVSRGEQLTVVAVDGEWVEVDVDSDTGFVNAQYVEIKKELPKAMTLTEARFGVGVSDARVAVCNFATQFVGNPYVWGGTSLTRGADCSGFVLSVFANYGVYLPHSSRAQANCGRRVSMSEIQPGDLIFYGSGKRINHVAIYIGGGQIVHASNPKSGIKISSAYNRSPICATRVID